MKGMRWALIIFCVVVVFGCARQTKPPPLDPLEKARVYYEQGVSLSRQRSFKKALLAFRKAVRLYPSYGDAYYNMGIIYHELDEVEDSMEAYKKAIGINPEDVGAHNNLGNLFLRQGQLSAAILEFEKAVKFDPTYGLAHHNLACAYFFARMHHRAWEHLNESKRLGFTPDPDLVEALSAELHPEQGQGEEKE